MLATGTHRVHLWSVLAWLAGPPGSIDVKDVRQARYRIMCLWGGLTSIFRSSSFNGLAGEEWSNRTLCGHGPFLNPAPSSSFALLPAGQCPVPQCGLSLCDGGTPSIRLTAGGSVEGSAVCVAATDPTPGVTLHTWLWPHRLWQLVPTYWAGSADPTNSIGIARGGQLCHRCRTDISLRNGRKPPLVACVVSKLPGRQRPGPRSRAASSACWVSHVSAATACSNTSGTVSADLELLNSGLLRPALHTSLPHYWTLWCCAAASLQAWWRAGASPYSALRSPSSCFCAPARTRSTKHHRTGLIAKWELCLPPISNSTGTPLLPAVSPHAAFDSSCRSPATSQRALDVLAVFVYYD